MYWMDFLSNGSDWIESIKKLMDQNGFMDYFDPIHQDID